MNKISEITILIVLYDETEEIIFKNLEKIKNFKLLFKNYSMFFTLKFFNLIKYYARVVAYIKFKK